MLPKNGDWSKLLDRGENPNGLVSYTNNGTRVNGARADGEQINWYPQLDGPRWSRKMPPSMVEQFIGADLPRRAKGVKKDK